MSNPLTDLRMIGAILKDISTFEDNKPIVVQIPTMTTTANLSAYGLGDVSITEGGTTITIQKLN